MTITILHPASPRNCLQCDRRSCVLWLRAGAEPEVECTREPGVRHPVFLDRGCFREEPSCGSPGHG
ncbi:MAG: hypothetical protein AAB368_17775 [bacterium]